MNNKTARIETMWNQETFVEQLRQLVACRTLPGDVDENARALDLVTGWLGNEAVKKRVKNGKAEILIASNTKTMSPNFALMVHMDVVAGRDDQFEVEVGGDRLIGRGVSDMKFSVPMGIALVNELVAIKSKLKFSLVITTDEEVGGFEGAKFLEEKMGFLPKVLIVPDGGDNLFFVNKAKGICQILVESKGKPAHASRPWLGKNALESLVKLANKLLAKFEGNNRMESWKTTMNIGLIQGGISTNQVCAEAIMKLDFRFPETESEESIIGEVAEAAKQVDGNLKVSQIAGGLPTFTDETLPVVKRFIGAMEKAVGQSIEIKSTYGGSDARWFAKHNTPVLMIKPIGGEIHSDNEWISLSSCAKFFEGVRSFLINN